MYIFIVLILFDKKKLTTLTNSCMFVAPGLIKFGWIPNFFKPAGMYYLEAYFILHTCKFKLIAY